MSTNVRNRAAILAVMILLCVLPSVSGSPDKVVVPNALQNKEGNISLDLPFDLTYMRFPSNRTQQVYLAQEFQGLPKLLRITEIAFRPDLEWGEAFDAVLPEVVISLSTTSAAPDHLSTSFSANVGADELFVYKGPLSLSTRLSRSASGPSDFDIRIKLQTPFSYDPGKGNLLLDVRNLGAGLTTAFDAEEASGDAISRVFTWTESYASPIGWTDGTYSVGLVTEFTFEAGAADDGRVSVDIRPGACPNPINTATMGVLPLAIAGSETMDVTGIDPTTIAVEGVPALRWSFEDVTRPYDPAMGKVRATDCAAAGPDGLADLALKFDLQAVVSAMAERLQRPLVDGDVVTLSLTGRLLEELGGSPIVGEDVVLLQVKKSKK